MKTLVVYYSYSGNTKALANKTAQELGADIEEINEIKSPSMLVGIHRAVNRIRTEIHPIKAQLDDYDKIIIMSPVWADYPVSAIYSFIDLLPKNKQIEFMLVSGGGGTVKSIEGTKALAMSRCCEVVDYSVVSVKINKKTGDISIRKIKQSANLSYLTTIGIAVGTVIFAGVGVYTLVKKFRA